VHRAISAVGVAGLLALTACASREARTNPPAGDTATPSPGVVAWVDRPAPPYVEPTPTPPNFSTDARPCHASDLAASAGGIGAAGGTANIRIDFTNQSTTPCVLLGQPTLAGISADGSVTDLNARLGSIIGDAPWPAANIAPGETAAVNVSSADACEVAQEGEHRFYPTLRIGLPSGDAIDVPSHGFDTVCGIEASQFGVPALEQPPEEPPPSPLTAHMSAPTTAHAGEEFSYTVTLRNRSDTDYPLTPCPAYEEYVSTEDGYSHPNYYLNCDGVQDIPAGEAVTYEMRLEVPAEFGPANVAKFGWHLQGDSGPGAVAPLEITN